MSENVILLHKPVIEPVRMYMCAYVCVCMNCPQSRERTCSKKTDINHLIIVRLAEWVQCRTCESFFISHLGPVVQWVVSQPESCRVPSLILSLDYCLNGVSQVFLTSSGFPHTPNTLYWCNMEFRCEYIAPCSQMLMWRCIYSHCNRTPVLLLFHARNTMYTFMRIQVKSFG